MTDKIIEKIWVDAKFFGGDTTPIELCVSEADKLNRAFEIWDYGHNEILESHNREKLSSGVNALKRAYNSAVQSLNETFGLQHLGAKRGNKGDMVSLLEEFGVIKTKTLNNYFKVRNMIEHQDAEPPEKETCVMYSEYMWCLLKMISTIYYNYSSDVHYENEYGFLVFQFRTIERAKEYYPEIRVYGALQPRMISFTEMKSNIKLLDVELIAEYPDSEVQEKFSLVSHQNNKICFTGRLEKEMVKRFVKEIIIDGGRDYSNERFKLFFR